MIRHRAIPLLLGLCGFLLSSAIAGQLIFQGQGDTPAISFRYGLLYLLYCGVPWAVRGEYPFLPAVLCQLVSGVAVYWLARVRVTFALIVLGCAVVIICIWLFVMAPQFFS
jgi:hypothetical protein